eukprot:SAG22_NODE_8494_length_651_cov_1.121377_1_plen_90_part_10
MSLSDSIYEMADTAGKGGAGGRVSSSGAPGTPAASAKEAVAEFHTALKASYAADKRPFVGCGGCAAGVLVVTLLYYLLFSAAATSHQDPL